MVLLMDADLCPRARILMPLGFQMPHGDELAVVVHINLQFAGVKLKHDSPRLHHHHHHHHATQSHTQWD